MKIKLLILIVLIFCLGEAALAASSSASYKITSEKIAPAASATTSTSYRVQSSVRERELQIPTIGGYKIGEGFMRSAYFSAAVILAPLVTSISPSTATSDATVALTISGANFASGATVKLSLSGQSDISATNVVVVSSTQITCTLALTGAKAGLWTVTVTSADGRSGSLPSALNVVYAAPTVTAITPAVGLNNAAVAITDLAGTGFRSGATATLQKTGETTITATSVAVISSSKITCVFDITNADPGSWDVVVTNSDNQAGSLSHGFKINAPEITVTVPPKIVVTQPAPPTGGDSSTPSLPQVQIAYSLSKDADITVYIFNMRGEKVWEWRAPPGTAGGEAGANTIMWDGVTAFKGVASAGVYFVYVNVNEGGTVRTVAKQKFAIIK